MTPKSPSWNRRRFLGATIGGSTALALSPRLAPASVLGANDRIRIGVAGTGGRARYLMRLLKELPGCEMVAVSDVYEPRMLEAAEIAGPPRRSTPTTGASSTTRTSTPSSWAARTTGTSR